MRLLTLYLLTSFSFSVIAQESLQPTPDSILYVFNVLGNDEQVVAGAKITIQSLDDQTERSGVSDAKGNWSALIKKGSKFSMKVYHYDTIFDLGAHTVPSDEGLFTFNFGAKVTYVEKYTEIFNLDIRFPSNEYSLDEEAKRVIDELFMQMTQNLGMVVEIAAHTDNVGSDEANKLLSQNRAESVRSYLLSKGIKEKRIKARGYGETVPLASNETPEGRAKNRRVEVRIINQ